MIVPVAILFFARNADKNNNIELMGSYSFLPQN